MIKNPDSGAGSQASIQQPTFQPLAGLASITGIARKFSTNEGMRGGLDGADAGKYRRLPGLDWMGGVRLHPDNPYGRILTQDLADFTHT